MSWLFEANPWLVLVCGLGVVAMLLYVTYNSGQKRFLVLALAALMLTGLVLLIEWAVVTPYEEIEGTLQTIAGELERHDHAAVLEHISTTRPDLRSQAQRQLSRVKIEEVKIAPNLEIQLDPERGVAEATFNARIRGSFGPLESQSSPMGFRVFFRKEEDSQWRIRDYEIERPEL